MAMPEPQQRRLFEAVPPVCVSQRKYITAALCAGAFTIATVLFSGCDGRPGDETPEVPAADVSAAKQLDELDRLIDSGAFRDAEEVANKLHADGMRHPRLAYIRGLLAERRGATAAAEAAFEEAIATAPRWFEPKAALADHYLKTERIRSAESLFTDLDQLFPHHPIGPYGLGMVNLRYGKIDQAEKFLLLALERSDDYPPALLQLARLRRQQQNDSSARILLGQYLALVPQNPGAWVMLGEVHQAAGRLSDAADCYRRALALSSDPVLEARLREIEQR